MSDLFSNSIFDTNQDTESILPILNLPKKSINPTQKQDSSLLFLDTNAKAKDLSNQVSWVITHKKTQYLDELINLQSHKSISIRRKVASGLGNLGSQQIIINLQQWQKKEPDRETWLLLDSSIDKLNRKLDNVDNQTHQDIKTLTVSEAIQKIKQTIGEKEYSIIGEVSDLKVYPSMYYFALKDKEETKINCSIYAGKVATFGFPINEGWSFLVTGKFKINKDGRFYFDVFTMRLTGEGELLRNLVLLEEKLTKEGLFDQTRKRQINLLPKVILLIASPNSAAIDDFQKILSERRQGVIIYYIPIKTQGMGAESDILEKLEMARFFCEELPIETIVITRGGGSQDDLMIWNSEKIVRAIHQLPKPTIVGIGHERDTCLCEKVADIRASTPTNAAELISITTSQVTNHLDGVSQFLQNYFWNRKNEYNQFSQNIFRNITQTINVQIYQNKLVCQKTEQIIFQTIQNTKNSITQSFSIILFETKNQTAIERQKLANLSNYQQIIWQKILEYRQTNKSTWQQITQFQNQIIQSYKHQLELYSTKVELYQPQKILALGYSILEQNGKKLSKTTDIEKSKPLKIQMINGSINLKITSIESKTKVQKTKS